MTIEYVCDNENRTAEFPKHPVFKHLSLETREYIMVNVNRTN